MKRPAPLRPLLCLALALAPACASTPSDDSSTGASGTSGGEGTSASTTEDATDSATSTDEGPGNETDPGNETGPTGPGPKPDPDDPYDDPSACEPVPRVCGDIYTDDRWDFDTEDFTPYWRCVLEWARDAPHDQAGYVVESYSTDSWHIFWEIYDANDRTMQFHQTPAPDFGGVEDQGSRCTMKAPAYFEDCLENPSISCVNEGFSDVDIDCTGSKLTCPWDF